MIEKICRWGLLLLVFALPAQATAPPCKPCVGLLSSQTEALVSGLAEAPTLKDPQRLYAGRSIDLSSAEDAAANKIDSEVITPLSRAGATVWLPLVFRLASPLTQNEAQLQLQLERATNIAKRGGERLHVQIVWDSPVPSSPTAEPAFATEYAYLLKRAAVAVRGANPQARVITMAMPLAQKTLERLYQENVDAYLDGLAFVPQAPADFEAARPWLEVLDPGKPMVVGPVPVPQRADSSLALAAEWTTAGASVVLFETEQITAATVQPLKVAAREFQGDLSWDPSTKVSGTPSSWTFVRGEDLGLRVVLSLPSASEETLLVFPSTQLRNPRLVDLATGEEITVFGARRGSQDFQVPLKDVGGTVVLKLDRLSASEIEGLEGLDEAVTITDSRSLPVEEILSRLQASEDSQARRLNHYQATNTTHLRFQVGTGVQTVEATFEGPFYYIQDGGFDWAWETFYINGIKWRGKKLPEVPLIQPEKSTTLPLEIHFSAEYDYELRGTEDIEGRPCYKIAFRPQDGADVDVPGATRHEGTVWVDQEIFVRVRSRSRQLGLTGEVLSNEEIITYSPVDDRGQPAPWALDSFFLPLRTTGQQLLSIINATTVVEREVLLTAVRVNGSEFERNRQATAATDVTMVRDTDAGLRYLVPDEEGGERVVKEGFDTTKVFAVGGVFFDDALDFPLPLGGINYFSLDFRGSGNQANVFFAGALLTASYADPRLGDTKFDLGGDLFGLGLAINESLYRDGVEVVEEEIALLPVNASLKLGRPLGQFTKLGLTYGIQFTNYQRTEDTGEGFLTPSDPITQSLGLNLRYARSGYSLSARARQSLRSEWEPWGFAGNPDYDPSKDEYSTWAAAVSKTWHLPKFQKAGLELAYLGGDNLDRFSKYEFGFFGESRVHGYQSNLVRAEEVVAAHVSYGFDLGEVFRVDLLGDAAWATDELSGLDNELLAGVGLSGTFIGPWQTIVNLDIGFPVAGPDDGFSLYLVFLKLFG